MTSEALQNPYFVRLYCKNIDKTHSLTEPNDKIQYHGNYFFKKRGGTTFEKGGEPTPCSPPPLNPPLLEHPLRRVFVIVEDPLIYSGCYFILPPIRWEARYVGGKIRIIHNK